MKDIILESLNDIISKEENSNPYPLRDLKKDLGMLIQQVDACEGMDRSTKAGIIGELNPIDLSSRTRDEQMKKIHNARRTVVELITKEVQEWAKKEAQEAFARMAEQTLQEAERKVVASLSVDEEGLAAREAAEQQVAARTDLVGRVTQIREAYQAQIGQRLHRNRFYIGLGLGLVVGAVAFQFALLAPIYAAVAGVGVALTSTLALNANMWASLRQGWSNFRFAITHFRGILFSRGQDAYNLHYTRVTEHHVRPVCAQELANDAALVALFNRFTEKTQEPTFVDNVAQIEKLTSPTPLQKALWEQKKVNRLVNSSKPVEAIIDNLEQSAQKIRTKYSAV